MGKEEQLGCGNENWEGRVLAQHLVYQLSWVLTLSQTGRADIPWLFPEIPPPQDQSTVLCIPAGLLHGSIS